MTALYSDDFVTIYHGDAWELAPTLEPQSIHTIVTSPPYWGLRDYGEPGQFGLESTPEDYVAKLVALFALLRPALRDDGTVWLNLGDCYATTPPGCKGVSESSGLHGASGDTTYRKTLEQSVGTKRNTIAPGLKAKDLVGIPWRVAFALQADGWYLRSDIIWHKPNPMPESVTDRPTKAHEYVFLLSKSPRYFYDHNAVKEPSAGLGETAIRFGSAKYGDSDDPAHATKSGNEYTDSGTRNKRSVWTVATKPFSGAHFAVFPPDLIKPCILAGAPEKCCPECGAPWKRQVERIAGQAKVCPKTQAAHEARGGTGVPVGTVRKAGSSRIDPVFKTTGFAPTCEHGHEPIGGTVLDPFLGSGTTAQVARSLGRKSVGFELNAEYIEIAAKHRLSQGVLL